MSRPTCVVVLLSHDLRFSESRRVPASFWAFQLSDKALMGQRSLQLSDASRHSPGGIDSAHGWNLRVETPLGIPMEVVRGGKVEVRASPSQVQARTTPWRFGGYWGHPTRPWLRKRLPFRTTALESDNDSWLNSTDSWLN